MKKIYITWMSVICAFAVVFLHVNTYVHTFTGNNLWVFSNVMHSIFYFPVPIFFMISGATLIDYRDRYDTKTYFKKRFFKVVLPYILWSFITFLYLELKLVIQNQPVIGFKEVFENLLNGEFNYYWFFIPLFTLYLVIPVISLIPKEKRQKVFLYIIILGLITVSLLPFIFNFCEIEYTNSWKFPIAMNFVLLALIGYYIDNYDIKPICRYIVYTLAVAGFLTLVLGTHFMSFSDLPKAILFKGYDNLPAVLYSSGIFLLFKNIKFKNDYKLLNIVSKTTFGIYLIQFFIINIFEFLLKDYVASYVYIIFMPIVVFLLSFGVTWVIQKIPYVKHILP